MPSTKIIKRRIASIGTTKKIMRAMGMVATSKLQKDRARLMNARSFFAEADRMIHDFVRCDSAAESTFLLTREVKSTAYVVITSDRGLCGGHNTNIAEKALAHMGADKNEKIIAIGHKGSEYLRRRGKNILRRFDDVRETAFYEDIVRVVNYIVSLYTSGEIDEVYVVYARFETMLSHTPEVTKLLPIEPKPADENEEMTFEPDVYDYLDRAINMYIGAFLNAAINESIACEQAARTISMDYATKNATEIIDKLTLAYNRRRQASITQEISEVISGADMLK